MSVLAMVKLTGDPQSILDAKAKYMDPVAAAPFAEHGHLRQIVAQDENSVVVLNIWDNPAGRDLANADPNMQEARSQILTATSASAEFANWEIVYEKAT